MRRYLRNGLGVVKIVAILEALAFGDLGLGGDDLAGLPYEPANASRTAAISLIASARICPTPSSTFSIDSRLFSAMTNSWAAAADR